MSPVSLVGSATAINPRAKSARPQPNQTEQEAMTVFSALAKLVMAMRYNSVLYPVLNNSHSYTPDWTADGVVCEVKGEHIHSRDSRVLFDACRAEHPDLVHVWARKRTTGKAGRRWEVTVWLPSEHPSQTCIRKHEKVLLDRKSMGLRS